MSKRSEMLAGMKRDYPDLPKFVYNWALDLYAKDPDYFQNLEKNDKKLQRKKKTPAVPNGVSPPTRRTSSPCGGEAPLDYKGFVEVIDRDNITREKGDKADPDKIRILQEPTVLDFEKININ